MALRLARTRSRIDVGRGALRESLWPGILAAIALAFAARWLSGSLGISALTIAVVIGMVIGNIPLPGDLSVDRLRTGLAFVAKHVLRVGVIALGMRLSIDSIGQLGIGVILTIIATVTATFFGTQALGRRLGVSRPLSLLIATCLLYTSPSPRDS